MMVDLLDPGFWLAVGALIAGLVAIALVSWAAWKVARDVSRRRALELELEDILNREEMQRLRHRDFEAFCAKVNEIRASKGQGPVEKEFLAKIQYNLMYALDESDF
jgi:biopolymer transport protein ExbB/TolQ